MAELVTLTMNPAIDIATSVYAVVPTVKLRCADLVRSPGGGGINVARVLSRLGHEVVALYPAGGPTGERLTLLLGEEGIVSKVVTISGETRESFTILEGASGKEYRFVLPGPAFSISEASMMLAALETLEKAPDHRFVVLSGSLPEGVSEEFYAKAAEIARISGAKVILDTSGPALAQALKKGGLTLIKPSLRELSELVKRPLDSQSERLAACREIMAVGGVEFVALTMGSEGAMLVGRDVALYAPAVPVEVNSAVGAGDSFLGAMVAALAEGAKPREAFRRGVAAGSAALLLPGTSLCRNEDVDRLVDQVVIADLS